MTADKEQKDIFRAKLIARKKIGNITFSIYGNRIFHVQIPKFEKVSVDIIDHGYEFVEANGGGRFYNIFEFDSFAEVDPEIRSWAADPEGNNYTYTDAIVIKSFPQKILADFYLTFNKPISPTKVFTSIEKAIDWTIAQTHKN